VKIEEHLAKHAENIDYVARRELEKRKMSQYGNPDDFDDVRQAIMVLMWQRHDKGAYNHTHTLWTYVQPALAEVTFYAINPYQHIREDKKDKSIRVIVVPPTDIDEEGIPSLDSLA